MCWLIVFQNFTQDNRTQGIMEKSQWDLKKLGSRGGDSHGWMTLCRYTNGCMMHSSVNMKTQKDRERKYGNIFYVCTFYKTLSF